MRASRAVAFTASLVLVLSSCDNPADPDSSVARPQGLPQAKPGQAIILSNPEVDVAEGPIGRVYFPKPRDLVADPRSGGMLVVSGHDADPLRIVAKNGHVSTFNSPSPESSQPQHGGLVEARTAEWMDDGSLAVYESNGEISRLGGSGPLDHLGSIPVPEKARSLPAKLLRGQSGEMLLVAAGKLWRISFTPRFKATEINLRLSKPILAASYSESRLYVTIEDKVVVLDESYAPRQTIAIRGHGKPRKAAPRQGGGVWILFDQGSIVEVNGEGKANPLIKGDENAPCGSRRTTTAHELSLGSPWAILQQGDQLYIADSDIGCQWIRAIGLPFAP